jgi:hypothetical protein
MIPFPIHRIDRRQADSVEQLGSKPKFWFRMGKNRFLFKADDRGTGEDWAELIASHLCDLLKLPHVKYEMAVESDGTLDLRPGVICANMAPPPYSLILGNQLLLALVDPQYPVAQQFRVRQHSVDAVCDIMRRLSLSGFDSTLNVPPGINTALDAFVGYIMLDAWIANQDRHHENWGALWNGKSLALAPTFDHGAGLGRNLLDTEREERLHTKDQNRTIHAFAQKGRSAFFGTVSDTRSLGLLEAFEAFSVASPVAKSCWLQQLRVVNRDAVWGILERVPAERMSNVCKEFTCELLMTNQRRLLQ